MAALPTDVGSGIIRIRMRKVGVVSSTDQDVDVDALTGKVIFTPSAPMLRHVGQGLMFPAYPVTAYLDAQGNADVQLMATDDAQITPVDWTYTVSFELDDRITIPAFSIAVPQGSDRELSDLTPVQDDTGTFYTNVGPPGPASTVPGPTGPAGPQGDQGVPGVDGEDGVVDSAAVAAVLGVTLVVSDTPPANTTLYGSPVVWVQGNSILTAVPVTPSTPAFNMTTFTVTAPSLTGVEYQIVETGGAIVSLVNGVETSVAGYTKPYILKVQAVAKPGYVLTAAYMWERLLTDSSVLANYANDSFAGTAGTSLATGNNAAQRTWDMVGGGFASPAPVWYSNLGAGVVGGLMIDATGTKAVKKSGAADTKGGLNCFNVGAANMEIDFVISTWAPAHSNTLSVYLGATTSTGTGAATFAIFADVGAGWLMRFPNLGSVASAEFVYRTAANMTEAAIQGTWRVQWVNKFMQVFAPDGNTYGRDYATCGVTFGNYGGIGVWDNSSANWPSLDSIKVLR